MQTTGLRLASHARGSVSSICSLDGLNFLPRMSILCRSFSLTVTHSRLFTWLFFLFPSLWFTCSFPSGFGINASATNLWMRLCFLPGDSITLRYPPVTSDALNINPVSSFLTCPSKLTEYHENPLTFLHSMQSLLQITIFLFHLLQLGVINGG